MLFHNDWQLAINHATPIHVALFNFVTNAGMCIPMSFVDVNVHVNGNVLQNAAENIFARLKADASLHLAEMLDRSDKGPLLARKMAKMHFCYG